MPTWISIIKGINPNLIYFIVVPIAAALVGAFAVLFVERYRHKTHYEETYWERQIDFYIDLWPALQDLKKSADSLWREATRENLRTFVNCLDSAEKKLNDNILLLDEDHLAMLVKLFNEFWRFESGKVRLLEIREHKVSIDSINPNIIVRRNGELRDRYDRLITEIETVFRNKLKNKKK